MSDENADNIGNDDFDQEAYELSVYGEEYVEEKKRKLAHLEEYINKAMTQQTQEHTDEKSIEVIEPIQYEEDQMHQSLAPFIDKIDVCIDYTSTIKEAYDYIDTFFTPSVRGSAKQYFDKLVKEKVDRYNYKKEYPNEMNVLDHNVPLNTTGNDIYWTTIAYKKFMGYHGAENVLPFYLASIGAHIIALKQRSIIEKDPDKASENAIFVLNDSIVQPNVHVLSIAPSGYGKSYGIETFLRPENGLLSDPIMFSDCGYATEAGLTGSIDQRGNEVEGLLKTNKLSILGFDEFSVFNSLKNTTFSNMIEPMLLRFLDKGQINKKLAKLDLNYYSDATIWGGLQPTVKDILFEQTGLARRFAYIDIEVTENMKNDLSRTYLKNTTVSSPAIITAIRKRIANLYNTFMSSNISRIEFSDRFANYLINNGLNHFQQKMYAKIAAGYWLITRWDSSKSEFQDKRFMVDLDDELKRIIDLEIKMTERSLRITDGNIAVIDNYIKSLPNPYDVKMSYIERELAKTLSTSYSVIKNYMNQMEKFGMLRINKKSRPIKVSYIDEKDRNYMS